MDSMVFSATGMRVAKAHSAHMQMGMMEAMMIWAMLGIVNRNDKASSLNIKHRMVAITHDAKPRFCETLC